MSLSHPPSYVFITLLLAESGAYLEATELHGLLSGFACGGLTEPNPAWMSLLLATSSTNRRVELEGCVRALFSAIYQQLSSFGFDFDVLLPSEESEPGLLRLRALSKWSENFMLGLSVADAVTDAYKNKFNAMQLPSVKDAKKDIQDISRIYQQALESGEDFDDDAFTTLLEHVRVVAMLIFTELNGRLRPTHH